MSKQKKKKDNEQDGADAEDEAPNPVAESLEITELLDLESGLKIAKIGLGALIEQDLNARVMSREKFNNQLTNNIKNRGTLESLPYCAKTEKGIEIISGHHRIRAARQAHLPYTFVLLDTNNLTRDEITAKQLAHNSINGVDDKEILAQLFKSITDLNAQIESAIDPKDIEIKLPDKIEMPEIDIGMDFKHISFFFLPSQLQDFKEVIESVAGDEVMVGVSDYAQFQAFKEAVNKAQKIEDIRSVGTALARMCEIVLAHYKPIEEKMEQERQIVPSTLEEGLKEGVE
jgi:hypothetical protein